MPTPALPLSYCHYLCGVGCWGLLQVLPEYMQVVCNHKLLRRLLVVLADQVELELSLHDGEAVDAAPYSCKLSTASELLDSCECYQPLALYRRVRFATGLMHVVGTASVV